MTKPAVKKLFNPSCSLMIYKPALADKVMKVLNSESNEYGKYLTCCKDKSNFSGKTQIITVCAGCQQRFGEISEDVYATSLWEVLAASKTLQYPDYKGKKMAIHDSCWYIDEKAQNAVRTLAKRMNIDVVEPEFTRKNTQCCGLNMIDKLPLEGIKEAAHNRASQMPVEDVILYCVTGTNYMKAGGKTPHYILDLLFEEKTELKSFDPHGWREKLIKYRE